jgi:uncharacterized tellurite resistance protein B-like protein
MRQPYLLRFPAVLGPAGLLAILMLSPVTPAIAGTHTHEHSDGDTYSYSYSNDEGTDFAYGLYDPTDNSCFVWGENGEWKAFREMGVKEHEALLWFRDGDHIYLTYDKATIDRANQLLAPIRDLGRQQGELGGRQGKLGGEQGRLGAEQGRLGQEQGRIAERQAQLESMMQDADLDTRHQMRDQVRELERRQFELERRMRELGEQQSELGQKQSELGRQQSELGRQQSELGRKALIDMRQLLKDAKGGGKLNTVDI